MAGTRLRPTSGGSVTARRFEPVLGEACFHRAADIGLRIDERAVASNTARRFISSSALRASLVFRTSRPFPSAAPFAAAFLAIGFGVRLGLRLFLLAGHRGPSSGGVVAALDVEAQLVRPFRRNGWADPPSRRACRHRDDRCGYVANEGASCARCCPTGTPRLARTCRRRRSDGRSPPCGHAAGACARYAAEARPGGAVAGAIDHR
ncbi:hypothetical protein DdX_20438 [Ditylenchus destructor]|uniref:Uncharacterized protein n=1 Tax=Ditylenchus destructor TaxID=166010 RepID=A0AAD4MLA7_9BILA|nr:hypothetical protein DdX_20438 [Ditylenchus destructor]